MFVCVSVGGDMSASPLFIMAPCHSKAQCRLKPLGSSFLFVAILIRCCAAVDFTFSSLNKQSKKYLLIYSYLT